MDFSFSTSLMLPNSASPQLNLQAASVFGSHEFSSIEQLPNAKHRWLLCRTSARYSVKTRNIFVSA
ncbi:MAG: hypothetical protein IJU35_03360 [Paludibacteraceae bacterium]|nr:hypothetical protein [Paludibacteraceae bacterium]